MKEYKDWSSCSGYLSYFNDKEIKEFEKKYLNELNIRKTQKNRYNQEFSFFERNLKVIQKEISDRNLRKAKKKFKLKKEHLILLKNINFKENEFFSVDYKRPFGNSNMIEDIAYLTGILTDDKDYEYLSDKQEENIQNLVDELQWAFFEILNRFDETKL